MRRPAKDGVSLLGFGAVACAACCIGPLLAFLGGLSVAGLATTWLIGGTGLAIAAAAATTYLVVRRRRRTDACTEPCTETCTADAEPQVLVGITTKDDR